MTSKNTRGGMLFSSLILVSSWWLGTTAQELGCYDPPAAALKTCETQGMVFADITRSCSDVCGDSWPFSLGSEAAGLKGSYIAAECNEDMMDDSCHADFLTPLMNVVYRLSLHQGESLFETIKREREDLIKTNNQAMTGFTRKAAVLSRTASQDVDAYREQLATDKKLTLGSMKDNYEKSNLPASIAQLQNNLKGVPTEIEDLIGKLNAQIEACTSLAVKPQNGFKCAYTCKTRREGVEDFYAGCCCYTMGIMHMASRNPTPPEQTTESPIQPDLQLDYLQPNASSLIVEDLTLRSSAHQGESSSASAINHRRLNPSGADFFTRFQLYEDAKCPKLLDGEASLGIRHGSHSGLQWFITIGLALLSYFFV